MMATLENLFEGIKPSLDVATSVSVIFAIFVYVWDLNRARKQEYERRENELILESLKRVRDTIKHSISKAWNYILELDSLGMKHRGSVTIQSPCRFRS